MKYYDKNLNFLMSFDIDESTIAVRNLAKTYDGCGDALAPCFSDKYTENGCDSVLLGIGTLFMPEVGVGVLVVCLYESDECK